MPLDLYDLRTFHDEMGHLLDLPRGNSGKVDGWKMEDGNDGPEMERRDDYLRRLNALEKAGKINPDGSWNH